ncbi:MAG: hypothetical protein Q8913_02615 [Bacteroidota bacterium]|nr:hypothetical protein [Bacteroidota bacterium]
MIIEAAQGTLSYVVSRNSTTLFEICAFASSTAAPNLFGEGTPPSWSSLGLGLGWNYYGLFLEGGWALLQSGHEPQSNLHFQIGYVHEARTGQLPYRKPLHSMLYFPHNPLESQTPATPGNRGWARRVPLTLMRRDKTIFKIHQQYAMPEVSNHVILGGGGPHRNMKYEV